ncbi:hypothetical protein BTJ49_04885 [Oleiagrimonas sp. MCCC 1A03011]|nr:hypothetical protein BTJ49_04885 [Oleiagrimonas sp. MCCC 1A03011]
MRALFPNRVDSKLLILLTDSWGNLSPCHRFVENHVIEGSTQADIIFMPFFFINIKLSVV